MSRSACFPFVFENEKNKNGLPRKSNGKEPLSNCKYLSNSMNFKILRKAFIFPLSLRINWVQGQRYTQVYEIPNIKSLCKKIQNFLTGREKK